ncbi:hypothetical protein BJY01DRAFT_237492 [Aspergillus pseudoustus]|uniref:4'-phosphopantetheinyl transferase domain-containing protein n=1 Tax=Aspergillus pseudoustus TaxID=1810923 RepID=A0ABR4JFJ6_9EURO
MVQYYAIAGRQIGSHHLALGILSSLFGGVYLATRGGSQAKPAAPPIKAESKDEETFIHFRSNSQISQITNNLTMRPPLPFPLALNIGTDIVHLPRITRLISRPGGYLSRFTRRILSKTEEADFRTRFALPPLQPQPRSISLGIETEKNGKVGLEVKITPDMARWLAGRFAAKEAARKAARGGASAVGWKDVVVRSAEGRPEIVFLDRNGEGPGRLGRLSISHDGEYVVATVLAAG